MSSRHNDIPNRSDKYQDKFAEISCSHELLDIFQEHDSIYKRLNPHHYNEEVAELEEELREELWRLMRDNLTPRQLEIVTLCASGKTQQEVAKILHVNQSVISKQISYGADFKNDGENSMYSITYKLRELADTDYEINLILLKIATAREEDIF